MKAIEADITVAADGKAVIELQLPPAVSAGKHRAVVVLDEKKIDDHHASVTVRPPMDMPIHDFGPWPANLSLRREDLYGDHGR